MRRLKNYFIPDSTRQHVKKKRKQNKTDSMSLFFSERYNFISFSIKSFFAQTYLFYIRNLAVFFIHCSNHSQSLQWTEHPTESKVYRSSVVFANMPHVGLMLLLSLPHSNEHSKYSLHRDQSLLGRRVWYLKYWIFLLVITYRGFQVWKYFIHLNLSGIYWQLTLCKTPDW